MRGPLRCLLLFSAVLMVSTSSWMDALKDAFDKMVSNGQWINYELIKALEIPNKVLLAGPNQILDTAVFTEEYIRNNTKFYLYTRQNLIYPSEIGPYNMYTVEGSYYEPSKKTVIVIHGFAVNQSSTTVQSIKNKLLEHYDVNVIAVDYSQLMDPWWYSVCVPCGMSVTVLQLPEIGEYVGEFINELVDIGQSPDNVHIVGHSLGAHVAGFAGKLMAHNSKTVARITGLDPSSPGFVGVGGSHRLAENDAQFTDCIFTSAKTIALTVPACKANFYPNGCGKSQPGCFFGDFQTYGGCSHTRSVELFVDSIDPRGIFQTSRCDRMPCVGSQSTCWPTNETLMGYRANHTISGIFLTETNDAQPFSQHSS